MSDDRPSRDVGGFLGRLRTLHLTLVLAALFVADLVIADPLPFVDELVLAAATVLVGRWQLRRRREE